MLSYYRVARQSILEYQQLPLRTHFFCGGYPLVANPLDGSLNPFFIPVLMFGEVIGLKINVFLAHIIAALGMYYLTRYVLGYDILGALFSTSAFCLGGNLHRLLVKGITYPPMYYFFMPLLLALFIKAKENKRYLIYTTLLFAMMLTQLSLRFLAILTFLFLFSLLEIIKYKNKRLVFDSSYIRNLFIIILFSFLLGAVKIFPMLELLKQNPLHADSYHHFWGSVFPSIYNAFFVHQRNLSSAGEHWHYFYLGYIPIVFCILSFLIDWHKCKTFFILLIIFLLFSFGTYTHLDLFRLLWQLPLFHSLQEPERYFIHLLIFIITLASGRFFLIRQKLKRKFVNLIFILVLIFTTVDLFFTNGGKMEESFSIPIPKYTKQVSFFSIKNTGDANKVSLLIPKRMPLMQLLETTRPTQYELLLQNIGKINAYTNIHLGEYATPKYYIEWNGVDSLDPANYTWHPNPDYKGEIYFLNHPNNKAEFQYFSPNKLIAKVSVLEPDILIINQNYDKYWRSDSTKPTSHNGLLAINLNKRGEYLVQFNYVPISFYAGLGVSFITLFFMIYYLKRK